MTWKRFWCAIRGHPYPVITPKASYEEGELPTWSDPYCSNCGASFGRNRGMHS